MDDHKSSLVGKIGLVTSTFILSICTWRIFFHICRKKTRTTRQRWITRRQSFHVFLWMAACCEVLAYAQLSEIFSFTEDRILSDKIDFVILNVVSRTLELLAFSTVTDIWLRTSIDAHPSSSRILLSNREDFLIHWLPPIFLLCAVSLVITSVSLSVVIFFGVLITPLSMIQTALEAMLYGINISMVILSISMTSKWILTLVPSTEWKRRSYLICKAVGPMIISSIQYSTRFVWLVVAFMNEDKRDSWSWWISFSWIPSIVLSIVLLYSIRKRDSIAEFEVIENNVVVDSDGNNNNAATSSNEDNSNDLQQSLLSRPQPPAEAFRSFHNFRRGVDIDDSFSLGSPIPHNTGTQLEDSEDESSH